jgi:uncharacterized membrane protein YqiK
MLSTMLLGTVATLVVVLVVPSIKIIGPTQVGLVTKRFSPRKLSSENPIAFRGEAGYQSDLLMPGWRFKLWILYRVALHPWVKIPAGKIGLVVAQVGKPLPVGAKSAVYKPAFGDFSDLRAFVGNGGEKGVQRQVLPPGTLAPIHPAAFLVVTEEGVFGVPISEEMTDKGFGRNGQVSPSAFGLTPEQLRVVRIQPQPQSPGGKPVDMIGIVTTYEGRPLPSGAIVSRIGGFSDIEEMEANGATDQQLMEAVLGSKNEIHNNYQDFQAFLDNDGRMGLQHDPLLYGAYVLNPFLVSIELIPMLIVEQGQVATLKSYVGLGTQDTSGDTFKFGSLVRPGHRGIWQESLRTGKYPINQQCYQWEIVPTSILTLNWAERESHAHDLDAQLMPIHAKSCEGFEFSIDLQVQIHVADTEAPWVISMVGNMKNLVNEVLQAAVGNHFRGKLQSMPAVRFIETRHQVQQEALEHIQQQLGQYRIETPGVYIQDMVLPADLVAVLTARELANQQSNTFERQEEAEKKRVNMENAKGTADMQCKLAQSQVSIDIESNAATARKAQAAGEAEYIERTGTAQGAKFRSIGMAKAEAFRAQVDALGQSQTAWVNIATALAEGGNRFVPEVLVTSQNGGGALEALAGVLTKGFQDTGRLNLPGGEGRADREPVAKECELPEHEGSLREETD